MNETMPVQPEHVVNPAILAEEAPQAAVDAVAEKTAKVTSFFSYFFQFIILGIKSIKNGFGAYSMDSVLDTHAGEENVDPNDKKAKARSKALEKLEIKKQNIRSNPKYIEMKQNLAAQLTAEAGQKYENPVVFEYTAMDKDGKIKKGKFNGVSKL